MSASFTPKTGTASNAAKSLQVGAQGFSSSSGSGSNVGNTLLNTASGAAQGYAVGGPAGAAVGGGSALLGGLFSGGSKKPKINESLLKLNNFSSPFGYVTNSKKGRTFTPVISDLQNMQLLESDKKITDLLTKLPTTFNPEDAFNSPIYASTLQRVKDPIDTQRRQDEKSMMDQLSAANQLGSSYDAYTKNLMNNRYDQQYRDAEGTARETAYSAYQQSLQNMLTSLQTIRNDRTSLLDAIYRPLSFA